MKLKHFKTKERARARASCLVAHAAQTPQSNLYLQYFQKYGCWK